VKGEDDRQDHTTAESGIPKEEENHSETHHGKKRPLWQRLLVWATVGLISGMISEGILKVIEVSWEKGPEFLMSANRRVKNAMETLTPYNMAKLFYGRIGLDEYGWRLYSWSAPFNASEAKRRLEAKEMQSSAPGRLSIDWNLQHFANSISNPAPTPVPGGLRAHWAALWRQPESDAEVEMFTLPNWWPLRIIGLPDAFLHTARQIFAQGMLSDMVALAAVAAAAGLLFRKKPKEDSSLVMILLLPAVASLIAFVFVLPILAGAAVLNWSTHLLLGSASPVPQLAVTIWGVLNFPVHSLFEHSITTGVEWFTHGLHK
jgi:hypothetical protein